MKTAYLAGPIASLDYRAATGWREYAATLLAAHGILGLSPMRSKSFLSGVTSFSKTGIAEGAISPLACPRGITTRDRYDATTCDVLLVNLLGARTVSIGTCLEIAWADLKRTPIVCAIEDDGSNPHEHGMINEALGYRTPSLDEALNITISIIGGRT